MFSTIKTLLSNRKLRADRKAYSDGFNWVKDELAKGTNRRKLELQADDVWNPGHPFDLGAQAALAQEDSVGNLQELNAVRNSTRLLLSEVAWSRSEFARMISLIAMADETEAAYAKKILVDIKEMAEWGYLRLDGHFANPAIRAQLYEADPTTGDYQPRNAQIRVANHLT